MKRGRMSLITKSVLNFENLLSVKFIFKFNSLKIFHDNLQIGTVIAFYMIKT